MQSASSKFDLSIAIVNWNTKQYLSECLKSLRQHLAGITYEIIVVDNNSSDGSQEMIKSTFSMGYPD